MTKKYKSKRRGYYNNSRRSVSGKTSKDAYSKYISKATTSSQEGPYSLDMNFIKLELDPVVLRNIHNRNFKQPTKIQSKVIPEILKGRDVLGLANTGSGKTAAFLLPLITKVVKYKNNKCLIITPTRELARQIRYELDAFSLDTKTSSVLIVGGAGYGPQIKLLSRQHHFVIATPGRLIDLHKTKKIDLYNFNNVVVDEVDTMLDMGFIKDIELIISKLNPNRQSMFFSATMNSHVEHIARNMLKNPVKIEENTKEPALNVEQSIHRYKFVSQKVNILHEVLMSNNYGKFLVFVKTRRGADILTKELKKRGHKSVALHGNKSQGQRNKAVSQFRNSVIDILVATDVASRGIDIENITHVINYDEPATYDDYIHRIGRTGRIGKKGNAITFVK